MKVGRAESNVSPRPLKVLVVDDSISQRSALVAMLNSDPDLEVIGIAADGAEAVSATRRIRPDVIMMDLRMPIMDGLEASRQIMSETPTPIVMVTEASVPKDQHLAFEALRAGALALVSKPSLRGADRQELISTVKTMARIKVWRRKAASAENHSSTTNAAPPVQRPKRQARPEIIAIGASTGGPGALRDILASLPGTFPVPLLIVQHIAPGFISGLVDWLAHQSALPIQLAKDCGPIESPGVYLAPTGHHLVTHRRSFALSDDPPLGGHRPSATALFQSVAREYGPAAIGVLLSGMGDDGAAGLGEMKHVGATTVAQDEATSTVFGMPSVAIGLGIVDYVLPPSGIAQLLVKLAAHPRGN